MAVSCIASSWDVSPLDLKWSADGSSLYATADNIGRHKLYKIAVDSGHVDEVWGNHSVASMEFLPGGKLLLSLTSFTSSLRSYIFDPSNGSLDAVQPKPVQEKDLSPSQVEEFWFPGADGVKVHGYIIKPSNLNKSSGCKTKMAFIIHGGAYPCGLSLHPPFILHSNKRLFLGPQMYARHFQFCSGPHQVRY